MVTTTAAALIFLAFVAAATQDRRSSELRRYPRRPLPDSIIFPDGFADLSTRVQEQTPAIEGPTEIPLELIMQLNEVENITDLFRDFIQGMPTAFGLNAEDILANRFGEVERKAVTMRKPAACMPEKHIVSLTSDLPSDPTYFYYPSCTRVDRCGGCCSHSLLSCQPSLTEIVNFQVIVSQYNGAKNLKYVGKELVPIEQHLKCKCDCIMKEKDCNDFQEYRAKECQCVCLNVDDEEKCNSERATKLWDPKTCTCGCRDLKECTTGYYFDEKTCSCVPVPITRRRVSERFGPFGAKRDQTGRFDYKIIPVIPFSEETGIKRRPEFKTD
ncbi:hypothetical protein J437_LFUL016190 [Ladona fulva]|uniref:Platelet-derived growth factor (PDGF) family profile domain-containing protein n=1 Tax=Ladona fulva TaxID=123851 RepID=A0A8K0KI16_LADFU|nr:hypothetical protein J437_LFUL016190 [Ladona fulva]